ncbi:MAG: GTP pyrophosphokinase family protein [Ignavibacteriaceae bacterium]|jgi:putative GTP pyrophosphokinase|nr:GTP pyrophosphokinase family protein [Ignavibacteriaceae bacterium]
MKNIDLLKVAYVFDGHKGYTLPGEAITAINSFLVAENLYLSATREIITKLENLNDEFLHLKDRNPIHQIKTRVKTPKSIIDKLNKLGCELSVESARENLTDIAGIRVICSYIDDIYLIADLLTSQDNIEVIRTSDYIKNPKPNGYRSLHMIVTVPVYLSDRKELVKVEIQIRTIAMNFWASLEHEMSFKLTNEKNIVVTQELKDCADVISNIDIRMQNLHNE